MKKENEGMHVLICGSQRFEQEDFVFNTLETFFIQSNGSIRKLFTSKFSGACEFAKNWAELKNKTLPDDKKMEIVEYAFDMVLERKNQSFYEDAELPAYAIANDPFFKQGKELLGSKKINLVLCFPNPEGKLGAATENIKRFATLGDIHLFDCSKLFEMVNAYKNEVSEKIGENNENVNSQESSHSIGFKNRHPSKR